ncbi:hypothetical protein ACFE04_022383 [Oxalis oulophora]
MNLSKLESDKTTSSDNPQQLLIDDEEEALTLAEFANRNSTTTTPQPPNPDNSINIMGSRKRKRTERKEVFVKSISENKSIKQQASSSKRSGKKKSHKKQQGETSHLQTKSPAMIRAEELLLNLDPQFPTFTRTMLRSHVASCFWLGLPGPFAMKHLPQVVSTVTLEAENGEIFDVKYFGNRPGLSQGWRQFAFTQNLLEGDVLIFQLTSPQRFKVYIIRGPGSAPGVPLAVVQKSTSESKQVAEQSENNGEVVGSEVLESYKLPTPTIQFSDVKSFKDFHILVDGSLIDSELQENIRKKYYDLCCSQKAFLHENIAPGTNHKLIVGTITETVHIADNLSNCKLTTSRDEFSSWENSLKAFELLGLKVGFLCARLSQLVKISFESENGSFTNRYTKAKIEKRLLEDEIKGLEAKLEEQKKVSGKCEAEIESLKTKADGYEAKFQKEVAAPW